MSGPGLVSLVGAGPGHPDHLTQKAVRCLREADLVFHDALVHPRVLALAERAECIDVGKRGGRLQTAQDAIQHLLIEAAASGRRVVRLKGGDPFVFGRGGEEALALQAAGIPFEVVPGVTSAIAAPALAGIPVTHRGVSSAVVVITMADGTAAGALLDSLPPGLVTIVALMSVRARGELVSRLLVRGWARDTAAAFLVGAATAEQWTWRGPLDQLPDAVPPSGSTSAPGTIIVGAVAAIPLALENGVLPQLMATQ